MQLEVGASLRQLSYYESQSASSGPLIVETELAQYSMWDFRAVLFAPHEGEKASKLRRSRNEGIPEPLVTLVVKSSPPSAKNITKSTR